MEVAAACLKTGASTASATATTWSTTGNNGGTNNALDTAYLGNCSGDLGVTNKDSDAAATGTGDKGDLNEGTRGVRVSPEHAMDNNNRFDAILFTFNDKVSLTAVQLGFSTQGNG